MTLAVVRSVDSARSLRGGVDVEEFEQELIDQYSPVSYTHLTLPTNREV